MTSLNYILARKLLKTKSKKQNGFTLIELMIVVAIVGVLTAVGLPELTKSQNRAKIAAAEATLTNAGKECSLDLILGEETPTTFANFTDEDGNVIITGTCETGTELGITATDTDATVLELEFNGDVPGVVAEDA